MTQPVRCVSFVIPAWNEERAIDATLDAIRSVIGALDVPCEIVVADDSSTDATAELARAKGARVITVRNRQIAATRNAGAAEARGDLLIFVDADTRVSFEVVRDAIDAVNHGAVGGGCALRFDGRVPFFARVLLAIAIPLYQFAKLASGCFLFCSRDAFEEARGFDTRLFERKKSR